MSALSTLTSLADRLRAHPPERDEAREALVKCEELAALLRAAASPLHDAAPPSPKRAAPAPPSEAGEALTLSSLAPELLARVVAALPCVADVCRVECVSRLFRGAPPPRSVVEEALRLRAWAKAEAAAERAKAAKTVAAKAEAAVQAAKARRGHAKEVAARAAAAEAATAAEASAREAEAEAEAEAGAAEVEREVAAALLAALPEGESSWKQWLVLEERRQQVARPLPVAGGCAHSAFVDAAGRLLTCGSAVKDADGEGNALEHQLGQGADVTEAPLPAAVLGLDGVRVASVAAGYAHTLALSADGALYSFGDGGVGALGHGDKKVQHAARRVAELVGVRVTAVACGGGFSVALTDNGHAYSWGCGRSDSLGHGDYYYEDQLSPRRIEALAGVRIWAVAADNSHCMALSDAGALYSWGSCGHGELGHGNCEGQRTPRRVEALSNVRVTAVAVGMYHSLAVSGAGALYAWGYGGNGELGRGGALGHGDTYSELQPKVVEALGSVVWRAVAAGIDHSLALSEAGEVYSWGVGWSGQLGHGDGKEQMEPLRIAGLGGIRVCAVAAGAYHSLAVGSDGAVYGWGHGGDATLGLELAEDQLVPRRYSGLRVRRQ